MAREVLEVTLLVAILQEVQGALVLKAIRLVVLGATRLVVQVVTLLEAILQVLTLQGVRAVTLLVVLEVTHPDLVVTHLQEVQEVITLADPVVIPHPLAQEATRTLKVPVVTLQQEQDTSQTPPPLAANRLLGLLAATLQHPRLAQPHPLPGRATGALAARPHPCSLELRPRAPPPPPPRRQLMGPRPPPPPRAPDLRAPPRPRPTPWRHPESRRPPPPLSPAPPAPPPRTTRPRTLLTVPPPPTPATHPRRTAPTPATPRTPRPLATLVARHLGLLHLATQAVTLAALLRAILPPQVVPLTFLNTLNKTDYFMQATDPRQATILPSRADTKDTATKVRPGVTTRPAPTWAPPAARAAPLARVVRAPRPPGLAAIPRTTQDTGPRPRDLAGPHLALRPPNMDSKILWNTTLLV